MKNEILSFSFLFCFLFAINSQAQISTTIYDIQFVDVNGGSDVSPLFNQLVNVTGVVTASGEWDNLGAVFIQQEGQTEWAGIRLKSGTGLGTLVIGDKVTVTGTVWEDGGVTELLAITNIDFIGTGTIEPIQLDPNFFTSYSLANTEKYEGMLIEFQNAPDKISVVDFNPDDPSNFGEWLVGSDPMDANSGCRILTGRQTSSLYSSLFVSYVNDNTWATNSGTMQVPAIEVMNGDQFNSIRGIMIYGFGNMKLLPRNNADFSLGVFGTQGIMTTPVGNGNDHGTAIAIQQNGKIDIAGYADGASNRDFALVQYMPDGSLDNSFSGDGMEITDIGGSNDEAHALARQFDYKLVLAGSAFNGSNLDFALVRYNFQGGLDTGFDGDGKLTTPVGSSNDEAFAVAIQSDGKILAAGRAANGATDNDFAVVRYNADGSLDASFDGDGKVITQVGSSFDVAYGMAIQPDGKIVVIGFSNNGVSNEFAVVRYNTNGSLDTSFDGDGKLTTSFGGTNDVARAVAIQPDGKILVAGFNSTGVISKFALARYLANGALDSGFGNNGIQTTIIDSDGQDSGFALGIMADGKIALAGASFNGANKDFAVAVYDPNGNFINKMTSPVGNSEDEARGVAVLPDGTVIAAGETFSGSNFDFAMVKFQQDLSVNIEVPNANDLSVSIFPNPVNEQVTLEFALETESSIDVSLFDLHGRLVQQLIRSEVRAKGEYQEVLNLNHSIAQGIYFLVVQLNSGIKTIKLVKH